MACTRTMFVVALAMLAGTASSVDPRIFSAGSDIVINSGENVKMNGQEVHVNGKLMYQSKDGESMLDAQDIVPHLETLDATTAGHTDTLAAHDTTLGAHDDALAAQSTRIDTLNATLGMQKTSIDALGQRMDESEAAMAEIIKPSDEGVEIHTGAEDGGHVRIFADEIDLNGPVQVLDTDGKLVNINNLPAEVAQLRMEMAEVLEKLNGDLASAVEEIRDLKSRCDFAYEWEVAPYTPTSDRVCRALTECQGGQYEERPPSKTSDRVCGTHKACTAGMYEAEHPTPFHDRVCKPVTECAADEFEVTAPTPYEDRVCEKKAKCDPDTTFKLQHHEGGEVICIPLRECTQYEDEIIAPTATTDRVCRVKEVTCKPTEHEVSAPTLLRPRVCKANTVCTTGTQYQTMAPTTTSDRVCASLTTCTLGTTFESAAPTATSNRVCSPVSTCNDKQREDVAPTLTSDRVCVAKSGCNPDAQYSYQVTEKLWVCMMNNDVVKSWDAIATACNLNGGYRLSSVRVMSHFGQPTEAQWTPAQAYMRQQGSLYFITGQAVRSCSWDDYKTDYTCNGLGYISAQSSFDQRNWDAATDGNYQEKRSWPNALYTNYGATMPSVCYDGGSVPGVEDWADGYIWR